MPHHPLPEPDTSPADWARPLYARQVAMLGELAEAGLDLALDLKDRVKGDAEAAPAQAMMAFGRAARAVRLSLMLQAQMIKALEGRDAHRDHLAEADARAARRDRQARVERIVERVAAEGRADADEVEGLVWEARERLDRDDIYDLMARPVSEVVAMVCRDLGLDPDWQGLAQEAWAWEERASGAAGWPLAAQAPESGGTWPNSNPSPLGKGDRVAGDGALPEAQGGSLKAPSTNRSAVGPPSPTGKDLDGAPTLSARNPLPGPPVGLPPT